MNLPTNDKAPGLISRAEWIGVSALALLAIALRFVGIGQESFWIDEVWSKLAIEEGVFGWVWRVESTPPLFFLLLKGWGGVFGHSHEALRGFSAVLGGLCVPAGYVCARRWGLGRGVALAAACVLLIHPMAYWSSQQNRYYMTMMLFGILWLGSLPGVLDARRRGMICWGFVAFGFLSFATHYYFLWFAAGTGVGALAWWAMRDRGRAGLVRLIANFGAMGLAMAVMLPLFFHQQKHAPDSFLQPPTWDEFWDVFRRFYWVGLWVWEGHWRWPFEQWRVRVILAATLLAVGGYAWAAARNIRARGALSTEANSDGSGSVEKDALACGGVLFCAFLLPTLAAFCYSRWVQPIFIAGRYPILFLPPFVLWLALGWGLWPRRMRAAALTAGVVACGVLGSASIGLYWREYQDFAWQGAIEHVERDWREGDAMVFCPDWNRDNFVNNGGEARNVLSAHDLAGIERVMREGTGRVWLFMWEQAPEDTGRAALQELRAAARAESVMELPQMTLTRINANP